MNTLPSQRKKHIRNTGKINRALEDLQQNHNHSWYDEVMDRNKENMNMPAISYRGNEVTYKKMKENSIDYIKSLKAMGISKGREIIACMANIPETIYLMLAANRIGAIINFICENFDPEYLKKIVMPQNEKVIFISDNYYEELKKHIDINKFENCVVISLADSLPGGHNLYKKYENEFYVFKNLAQEIKKDNTDFLLLSEFLLLGKNYDGEKINDEIGLDTEFTITYTSGSTKIGWPKAIVHTNRSYISIGRFHDSDLSLMPSMRNMRSLAHIPTHSNTDLVSCISDSLMQACTVVCEPIYDEHFFGRSLIINKPNIVLATRSFWLRAMKNFETDKFLEGEKLPFIVSAVAVGENICKNEETYINDAFKKLDAGRDMLPRFLRPATISVGGGDCEHGGLFFTLLKGNREKFSKRDYGLVPFQLTELAILREDGTECNYGEDGILVANSPCTMKEYRDDPDSTRKFLIRDAYGRIWASCFVWAYMNKHGRIYIHGRVGNEIKLKNGNKLPMYKISDIILKNKNVLSCETVTNGEKIISYVENYPDMEIDKELLFEKIRKAIMEKWGRDVVNIYSVQLISNKQSFVLTKSGKRNVAYLEGRLEDIENR